MTDNPNPVLHAAFYDQDTGDITDITSATMACLVADNRPYVFLPNNRQKWDITHRVAVETDHSLVER
jgi:hypothetical protein